MSLEKDCEFVSSRGILHSCDVHSYNPRSSCRSDLQYLINMANYPASQKPGMKIYVCSELLDTFQSSFVKHIRVPFKLFSGDSDLTIYHEALRKEQVVELLSNPLLISWGAQNYDAAALAGDPALATCRHKLYSIPIGLDYHTIHAHNGAHPWKMDHEGFLPIQQEQILKMVRNTMFPFYERIPRIYCNAHLSLDRFRDRKTALEQIPSDLVHCADRFVPRTMTWNAISRYAFVLSPFGNGMDCHRTWEALCLGAIPVVKRTPFGQTLFAGLPVLEVQEWHDITEQLLIDTITSFAAKHQAGQFQYDKLKLKHWI